MRVEKPWLAHYPCEVAPSYDYPEEHLAALLVHSARKFPERRALSFYGKSITYRQLLEQAYAFAHVVQDIGMLPGDKVGIMLPNCPQAVIAYYGSLMAGLVVVETNPMYTPREIHHQMNDSGARLMVALDLLLPNVEQGIVDTPVEHVLVTSIRDYLPTVKSILYPLKQTNKPRVQYDNKYRSWHRLLSRAKRTPIPLVGDGSQLALLQYTGGTTGVAKGVMLTHGNLVTNTIQCRNWCYRLQDGREVFLGILPFFHVFGMTATLNFSTYIGGTIVLLPRFDTKQVLQLIRRFRPTVFSGTPTMFIAILNHPDVVAGDLSSLEVCISGSAPLPKEIQDRFEVISGGRLREGYGLTEASPITHANNLWGERKVGIGIPFPDTEARVVDAGGVDVPVGEVGELIIRGPQVMQGYWNRPEETAEILRDGWLYTGDLARMDSDGFFEIVGRRKDMIIAGGFNIYPREVEEVLYTHPAIEEAVVVGVADSYRGETVRAYVMLKQGMTVTPAELDTWCRKSLAAYKVPHQYEIRDSLPKSAVGKVLRYKLLEEATQATDAKGADTDSGKARDDIQSGMSGKPRESNDGLNEADKGGTGTA